VHSAHLHEITHSSVTFSFINTAGALESITDDETESVNDATLGSMDHDEAPNSSPTFEGMMRGDDELWVGEKGARNGEEGMLILSCEFTLALSSTSTDANCHGGSVVSE